MKASICLRLWLACLFLSAATVQAAESKSDLKPLVDLLGQIDDAPFQLDILKGMRDGLRGRKSVAMPDGWAAVYKKLSASSDEDVRRQARLLALVFGDPRVLKELRATMMDAEIAASERETALTALVERGADGLATDLRKLLAEPVLRRAALRGLGAYHDETTPHTILSQYKTYSAEERQDAIGTLAARPAYALALLDAVEKGVVPRREISAFTARQLQNLGDETVRRRLTAVWGEIRQTSQNNQALIAKYKKLLNPELLKKADLSNGRHVYSQTCMKCHRLFGEGAEIGPDLTGSNRANVDYFLENVLDPNAVIGKDYQLVNIETNGGRLLSGIIAEQNARTLTLQTLNERIVLDREEIGEQEVLQISMMPEGQLDKLNLHQVRDLVAYLASPIQVPLPAAEPTAAGEGDRDEAVETDAADNDEAVETDTAAAPLSIHMISGAGEYKSEPSLREFKRHLEQHYKINCTASWGRDGIKQLDGLESLKTAELMLIFARRMKLDDKQMKIIRVHWDQGKPVIGIRTAGHAFQQADNELFDREVLGGHYQGHYGGEAVKVTSAEKAAEHPVLAGVGSFTSKKLYKAGQVAEDTVVLQFGDIGKARHPVTIVHAYKGGRTFFTSLGVPEDFRDENFRRMLENAIFWTTKRTRDTMAKK